MSKETRWKMVLGELDPNVRTAILYLESMVHAKHREALSAQANKPQKVNLSKIESKLDSLQKQIDGLRPKIDAAQELVKEHDKLEQYLKKLAKNAEAVLDDMKIHFEQLYKSGYYKEGERRKIREEKILEKLKSEWDYKREEK